MTEASGMGPLTCISGVRVLEAPSIANCLPTAKPGCNGVEEEEGWAVNTTKNK
jgi:hypothetical protein